METVLACSSNTIYGEKMKVSIVTVSYNAAKTIEQTILSVLDQDYKNIEYVIIDGQSTDGTREIVEKYKDRLGYYVSEPDSGIYDAMNKGVKKATCDIIAFLNADDWYEKSVVREVVQWFMKSMLI
jgi:glycosyltransferase involved in cell wall biosynthesis